MAILVINTSSALNLFDSKWWYIFREINVLKSVNKLCFDEKKQKSGQI